MMDVSIGKLEIKSHFIRSILLSRFDFNTVTHSLGKWDFGEGIPPKIEKFLRKYTTVDELPRQERLGQRIEIKLNIFSTRRIVVLTSSFNIFHRRQNEPVICGLCFVFDHEISPKIFENYKVITNHIERLSKLYKNLHLKEESEISAVGKFGLSINQFVQVFNTLCSCGLKEFSVEDTVFRDCDFDSRTNRISKFLLIAFTSHLQTHGFSVVVGRNPREIGRWVNSLSLFLLPNERKRCRHSITGVYYVPELFVQGVLMSPNNKSWKEVVPMRNVLFGSFPITIIDLSTRRVLCFEKFNFFQLVKKNFMYLYDSQSETTTTRPDRNTKSILKYKHIQETRIIVPAVQQLFRCLFSLPERYREGYISEWIRLLNRKALSFTKCFEEYSNVNEVNVEEILRIIDVKKDDKLLLLAAAEKISPGVYTKVLGNLSEEVETVIDFLENL